MPYEEPVLSTFCIVFTKGMSLAMATATENHAFHVHVIISEERTMRPQHSRKERMLVDCVVCRAILRDARWCLSKARSERSQEC